MYVLLLICIKLQLPLEGVIGFRNIPRQFEEHCIKHCDWFLCNSFSVQDVHGGLQKAASPDLGWRNPSRTIIHIADAPGHGSRLADLHATEGMVDDMPDYDSDGKLLEALLCNLRVDVKVISSYERKNNHYLRMWYWRQKAAETLKSCGKTVRLEGLLGKFWSFQLPKASKFAKSPTSLSTNVGKLPNFAVL